MCVLPGMSSSLRLAYRRLPSASVPLSCTSRSRDGIVTPKKSPKILKSGGTAVAATPSSAMAWSAVRSTSAV